MENELRESYETQALYLSQINRLYSDHSILMSNIQEKEKKITEIQKVLRDLNDYKIAYLDLHKV